jgi:hypothetical protein
VLMPSTTAPAAEASARFNFLMLFPLRGSATLDRVRILARHIGAGRETLAA